MRPIDLDAAARAFHGIVTLESSGLSRSAWYRAVHAGKLDPLHPGVARFPGTARTAEQRIAAAIAAAGAGALASHRSAARLWGIPRPGSDPIDIIVPRKRAPRLSGVVVHRPTDDNDLEPKLRSKIPTTSVFRTLCDLGAVDPRSVNDAVGHVLGTKLATIEGLELTLLGHARPGRAGVRPLRRAIDNWTIEGKPADSLLEPAMAELVSRYRLPPVEFHPVIAGWEVDFRIVGTAVIVECDGWAYHGLQRSRFERDRLRDAELAARGWIVLRFTYRAITAHPARTARRIAEVVAQWADRPPPDAKPSGTLGAL